MSKVKLLVCEDDSFTLELLCSSLSMLYPDTVVRGASDGEAGLHTFREYGADIVLTDIDMPNRDGLQMIRDIQAVNPDVHTIVMTAYGEKSVSHSTATAAKVDHYFQKPVDYSALTTAIDSCIAELSAKRRCAKCKSERTVAGAPCS